MRAGALVLVAACWFASPASAARVWEGPFHYRPLASDDFTYARTDVATDGTQVLAWETPGDVQEVVARVDGGAPVILGEARYVSVYVAAAPGGAATVAWNGDDGSGETVTYAASTLADGTFGQTAELGPGYLRRLAMNERGDAAVLFGPTGAEVKTAFRPAGGVFGTPVGIQRSDALGLALTSAGESLIGVRAVADPPKGLSVISRVEDGPVSAPQEVFPEGQLIRLIADGHGRALATGVAPYEGENFRVLETAVRSADGSWSTPVMEQLDTRAAFLEPATNARGDALIAVRAVGDIHAGGGGPVRVVTGSMADPTFSDPLLLDGGTAGYGLTAAVGADGTAAIAYGDRGTNEVRLVRREGLGTFDAPQVVACGINGPGNLVFEEGGRALMVGTSIAWDAPAASPDPPDCSAEEPIAVNYSPSPVVAGRPVAIDLSSLRLPGSVLEGIDVAWIDGGPTEPRQPGDGAEIIRHVFPHPGRVHYEISMHQRSSAGCCMFDVASGFDVDVYAPATLRAAPRQSRRSVLRRGLRVLASAFTPAEPRAVTARFYHRGRLLGRKRFTVGITPQTVDIPLTRKGRRVISRRKTTRVRITLRQDGERHGVTRARIAGRRS